MASTDENLHGNTSFNCSIPIHQGLNLQGFAEMHIVLDTDCDCALQPAGGDEKNALGYPELMAHTQLFEPLNNSDESTPRMHAGFDVDTLEYFSHEIPPGLKACRCKHLPVEEGMTEEETYWSYIDRLNARVERFGIQAVPRWFTMSFAHSLNPNGGGKLTLKFREPGLAYDARVFCTIFVRLGEPLYETWLSYDSCSLRETRDYRKTNSYGQIDNCVCRPCVDLRYTGNITGRCEVTGEFIPDATDDEDEEEEIAA
jgi:hypothetical protein